MPRKVFNIAAVADVHCGRESAGTLRPLFEQLPEQTDVLLLCGDLTDYGLAEEARILVQELAPARKIPILAVLGNHDYEGGEIDQICEILHGQGVILLDGHTHEVDGIGFVGIKGFGGGFDRQMLEPWGEPAIKSFVHETVEEALKLERGLAKLTTRHRVVLLHYSPLAATIAGEPPEIFPFLGSGRLEDPINRYGATVVFHGHAHRGAPEGQTREGIPVYNVALPVLRSAGYGSAPFRTFSIPLE